MKSICILFVLVFTSSIAFAQEEDSVDQVDEGGEFYISGGLSFPTQPSEFENYWNKGFNISVGFGYSISPEFLMDIHLDYNNFSFNEDKFLNEFGFTGLNIDLSGGTGSIFILALNFKAYLVTTPYSVSPYLIGGFGSIYNFTDDVTATSGEKSATIPGGYGFGMALPLGCGVDIPLYESIYGEIIFIYLEGKYVLGFTGAESGNTHFTQLNAGFKLRAF